MTGEFARTLAAARSGADDAWAQIYRELAPAVLGYLRLRGAAEPEDLLGQVFLDVVRNVHRFAGGERDFRSWVFTIAHRRSIDDVRSRAHYRVDPVPAEVLDRTSGQDAEQAGIDGAEASRMLRLIRGLSPEQRDVLILRLIGDLTVADVAAIVGKSPGAVKALQRRGLSALRRQLADEGVTL